LVYSLPYSTSIGKLKQVYWFAAILSVNLRAIIDAPDLILTRCQVPKVRVAYLSPNPKLGIPTYRHTVAARQSGGHRKTVRAARLSGVNTTRQSGATRQSNASTARQSG
jgi:hypothetical protein